jgi:transposase
MKELPRYGQAFKDKAVAKVVEPESAALGLVAREIGIGAETLEPWCVGAGV